MSIVHDLQTIAGALKRKRSTRSAFKKATRTVIPQACTCGSCKSDEQNEAKVSRLPASDVPEEKPFYDTLLVLFDQWKDRVWDADTFTLEMTTALAPLCTGIANGVLDQELAHPHIAGMGIPDFWREVTAQPMLDMVPAFLEQYLSMLVETTERAQEKKPDTWQVWAFGNTRADTLATDIVTATQAMTMMMFTGVYNAVMASPALDEE